MTKRKQSISVIKAGASNKKVPIAKNSCRVAKPNSVVHMLPRMPIGISDFMVLRTEKDYDGIPYWFVDKTLFIADIIKGTQITLITRPRRFGKTLNLSMLRYFFDIVNAERNCSLFADLAISKNSTVMAYQGKHPVVFLSLKSIGSNKFSKIIEALKESMSTLYKEHSYLLDEKKSCLDAQEKDFFERVRWKTINQAELENTVLQLTIFLSRHHKAPAIVLIDEYDAPLLAAFSGEFTEFQEVQEFYRGFLGNVLKDNSNLYKAVLTGITHIAGAGLFSKLNNMKSYNLLDRRYAEYFGFTTEEIHRLLKATNKVNHYETIAEWYNGYLFGGECIIYNPWSVLNYIDSDTSPRSYWVYTSDNWLLRQCLLGSTLAIKNDLALLQMENGFVEKIINRTLHFEKVEMNKEEFFWTLLLTSGYLKAEILSEKANSILAKISIPNKEIRYIYAEIFSDWLEQEMQTENHMVMIDYLRKGQIEKFCVEFKQFFLTVVSNRDVKKDTIEAFYHGFVLGLLGLLMSTHENYLHSNRESGFGFYDIVFEPVNPQRDVAIIIELKRLKIDEAAGKKSRKEISVKQLDQIASKGLQQIKDMAYLTELRARKVKQVALISLAFCGKKLAYSFVEPTAIDLLRD